MMDFRDFVKGWFERLIFVIFCLKEKIVIAGFDSH